MGNPVASNFSRMFIGCPAEDHLLFQYPRQAKMQVN
jgi:hypothetical protein